MGSKVKDPVTGSKPPAAGLIPGNMGLGTSVHGQDGLSFVSMHQPLFLFSKHIIVLQHSVSAVQLYACTYALAALCWRQSHKQLPCVPGDLQTHRLRYSLSTALCGACACPATHSPEQEVVSTPSMYQLTDDSVTISPTSQHLLHQSHATVLALANFWLAGA
jgi:hypothetical protein